MLLYNTYRSRVLGRLQFLGRILFLNSGHLWSVTQGCPIAKTGRLPRIKKRRKKIGEIQDFHLVLKDLIPRLVYGLLVSNYQLYARKEKRGAAHLFFSKNLVSQPCPKKKTRDRRKIVGDGCPNTPVRYSIARRWGRG